MAQSSSSIQEWLRQAAQLLRAAGRESPRLDAQTLLGHVLDRPRSFLIAHGEQALTPQQLQAAQALLTQRLEGRPVAHLLGRREFWSRELEVTPDTLIPRPDTETTLELALDRIPPGVHWSLLDLGTGTGALALMLALDRPDCDVIATDISPEALAVARRNRDNLGLTNIDFRKGDWFAPLGERRFHLIVSNPPYVPERDPHLNQGDVRFEPRRALTAGPSGLDDLERLTAQAPAHLHEGGWLVLEHGWDQSEAVAKLLESSGFCHIESRMDLGGRPRASAGQYIKIS